jgi:hypothetical protein
VGLGANRVLTCVIVTLCLSDGTDNKKKPPRSPCLPDRQALLKGGGGDYISQLNN